MCAALVAGSQAAANAQASEESTKKDTVAVAAHKTPQYKMKEVKGYIYDAATKQPVSGAHVQAFGDGRYSVMTEDNGQYTLKVPVFIKSLYIAVPEYNEVQVAIGKDGQVHDVALYSAKFNSVYNKTTNITASSKADIKATSAVTLDTELEKQFGADIHTVNRGGLQGQGAALFIRGLNTLNLNTQPLIVLDGIFMDMQLDRDALHEGFFNNVLAAIDPEDIENVEVLRNATSLYGARGANGVIIINTKRGHSMATKINVAVSGGFELAPSYTNMMNADQYRTYVSDLIGTTEYGKNHATADQSIPFLNDNPNYYWYPMYHNNTDWSKDLYRTAFTQNYKVNVQGGDEVAMYNLSLGYTQAQSTAKNNDFNRLNIRFNTDINLLKNITTQLDVAYSRMTYDLRDNGWSESYSESTVSSPNVLGLIQAPFLSKYSYYTGEDMKLHQSSVYAGKNYSDDNYPFGFASKYGNNTALANPYWILKNGDGDNKNNQEMTQFNLNVMPTWTINKHLKLTNRFAYQLNRMSEKYFLPEAGIPQYNLSGLGDVTSLVRSLFGKETVISNDLRIDWNNQYGAHGIHAFGGFRFTNNTYTDNYMRGYNAGNDKMPDMKNGLQFRSVNSTNDKWRNLAYYVQGEYNFRNTYYATVTMSAEASSRFGKETSEGLKLFGVKWGLFPSVQLGWVLSNESWLQPVKGINYLKLTLGYDESGNDAIPYAASQTYFMSSSFLKNATALELANIENPQIQWETTRRFNAGLHGSFLNNRIQAGVDFFISNTSKLLTLKSSNYMTGLRYYWTNEGSLRNIGGEASINAVLVNTKDFKWELGVSAGHYKNEMRSLPEGDYTTRIYGADILTSVGNEAGLFYGYKTKGVFASDKAASTAHNGNDYLKYPTGIKENPYRKFSAGDVHFVDKDGNGVIDASDRYIIGNPNPDVYGNIHSSFSYRNWTLSVNFKYSLGNDIYNYQRSQLESLNTFNNQTVAAVNRWTTEGQVTNMPRVNTTESDTWVNNERFSDRWIEDGSYLKLKTLRLSYQLPLSLSWIQGMTVWAEANNLFYITKYSGSDPEFCTSNSILYQGIDTGLLPQNRSFHLGLRLNL